MCSKFHGFFFCSKKLSWKPRSIELREDFPLYGIAILMTAQWNYCHPCFFQGWAFIVYRCSAATTVVWLLCLHACDHGNSQTHSKMMRIELFTSSSSILEWYSVYILDSHETVVLRNMQVPVVYYRHDLLAHSQAPGSMLEWYSVYICVHLLIIKRFHPTVQWWF